MSSDKEASKAEHLLSLIDKKNVWEIEILSSILNLDSQAFTAFVKKLPMAFGLAVSGKKLFITPELVRDVKEEIKEQFVSWHQTAGPGSYSQSSLLSIDIIKEDYARSLRQEKRSKVKITVYGENFITQKVIDSYLSRGSLQPDYKFEGGYEPINITKQIGNENIECQFNIINYGRDILSIANLLFELTEGFLFIFDPLDMMQIEKTKRMIQLLTQKRRTDLFVTFIAIIDEEAAENSINEVASTMTLLVEQLENVPSFKVSFAILSIEEQIERKIDDLLQTSQTLVSI